MSILQPVLLRKQEPRVTSGALRDPGPLPSQGNKKRKLLAALLVLAALPAHAQRRDQLTASFDWFQYRGGDPVAGRNTATAYRNPILQGFYPDPSVTRVGEDYYLVTSTFGYFPGIPVFHSKDLVNWTQIGNAIDRPDQLDFKRLGMSRGVFAPTIQAKDGVFYILNTCVDCGGNFLLTARDPAGPWSNPIWLPDLEGGIDPSLFFDEDGRAWIVNNGPPVGKPRYDGHRAIWIQEFDLGGLKTIGPRTVIADGGADISKRPVWIEGPHILRKDGYYYLVAAEGGTEQGHSEVVFRSQNILGPYVPGPNNPILTQRDLPEHRRNPITSSGHAQLVETQYGDWWATFLAVRPYAGNFFNTGRETLLMPVTWADGWPRITRPGEAIPYSHARPRLPRQAAPKLATNGLLAIRDEFDGDALPPYWMMLRNPHSLWYILENGSLVLTARHAGLGDNANPSFLARRQQNLTASAETVVRFAPRQDGDRAGLAAFQNDDYWASVAVGMAGGERVVTLEWRHGADMPATGATVASMPLKAPSGTPVYLRISARGADYSFAYATVPGRWIPLGKVDGTTLSTQTAGGFIGAVMGPYARSGEEEGGRPYGTKQEIPPEAVGPPGEGITVPSIHRKYCALERHGIGAGGDGEGAGLHHSLHLDIVEAEVLRGELEDHGLFLARLQRHPLEALQLDHRPRHRRLVVMDIELDDLVAGALAGIGHVDAHLDAVAHSDRRRRQHRRGDVEAGVTEPVAERIER